MSLELYCVSNWYDYHLISASSPVEAISLVYGVKNSYELIDNNVLSDSTVVALMCNKYFGFVEHTLENLPSDMDRVLWLDCHRDTIRFRLANTFQLPQSFDLVL